jgi:hypothetical protein
MARAGWSPAPLGGIGDWERRLPSPFSLRIALSEDGDAVAWSAMAACPEAHALLEALGADDAAAYVTAAPPAVAPVGSPNDIEALVAAVGRAAEKVARVGESVEAFVEAVRGDPDLAGEARVVVPAVYAVAGRADDALAALAEGPGAPNIFRVGLERWLADGTLPQRPAGAPETVIDIPWRRVSPAALWHLWRAGRRCS